MRKKDILIYLPPITGDFHTVIQNINAQQLMEKLFQQKGSMQGCLRSATRSIFGNSVDCPDLLLNCY